MGFKTVNDGWNSLKKQADALGTEYATRELDLGGNLDSLLSILKDAVSPSQIEAMIAQLPTVSGIWPYDNINYQKVENVCNEYGHYAIERQQDLSDVNVRNLS